MNVSPKVRNAALAGLLASVIVTYVVSVFPSLSGMSDSMQNFVVGIVTTLSAVVTGYATKAVAWAEKYVADHKTSRVNELP